MARINKRGILLTLGMVFVSLTILSFANVILNNAETSENRIKEFAESERIYNLDSSISRSMNRIMKYSLNETHNITFDGSVIKIRTRFNNQTEFSQDAVIEVLNITRDRLSNRYSTHFNALPILDDSGVVVTITSPPLALHETNSSRYFVYHDRSIYVDITTYPFNVVYLNGFNETNTERINFTYKGEDMEPFELNYNNAETGGVHTSCPVSCVELVVNKYYQGNYVDTQAYNFTSTYISSLSLAGLGVPTAGHVKYFAMNVSDPSWAGENRTVAFNWFVSGGLFSPSDSSEGLMILLPDFTGYNNLFDTSYYGHGINEPGDGRLSGETEIEIDVYLKDEALKHKGAFVSHPSYDITLPELDTKAENVRADYTGLL